MAYFECIVGNGGGGGGTDIPLIVICTSAFAGLTIICTDGTTTLTGQCPSSSPYTLQFDLPNTGTWTVSGVVSGVTYSERVVIQPSTVELRNNIDLTIPVYSAANDTVSYTGIDGATHTITTDNSGQATATITINPNGSTLTFTSSVAKNPSNLSADYSKSITLNSSTTAIYVMPTDQNIYWYGFIGAKCQSTTSGNGWSWPNQSVAAPTYNTNYIDCQAHQGIGFSQAINGGTAHRIAKTTQSTGGGVCAESTKTFGTDWIINQADSTITYQSAAFTGSKYVATIAGNTRAMNVYAFWVD